MTTVPLIARCSSRSEAASFLMRVLNLSISICRKVPSEFIAPLSSHSNVSTCASASESSSGILASKSRQMSAQISSGVLPPPDPPARGWIEMIVSTRYLGWGTAFAGERALGPEGGEVGGEGGEYRVSELSKAMAALR